MRTHYNILFYVAGYIMRSLKQHLKCKMFVKLVSEESTLTLQFESSDFLSDEDIARKEDFLNQINRGGLNYPSDLGLLTCLFAWKHYKTITENQNYRKTLLNSHDARKLYLNSFKQRIVFDSEASINELMDIKCSQNHEFHHLIQKIAFKMFNMMSKNLVSEINDIVRTLKSSRKASSKSSNTSKIKKLTS